MEDRIRRHHLRSLSGAFGRSALVLRRSLVQAGQGARRGQLPGGLLFGHIRCAIFMLDIRRCGWVREVAGWVRASRRHSRHVLRR